MRTKFQFGLTRRDHLNLVICLQRNQYHINSAYTKVRKLLVFFSGTSDGVFASQQLAYYFIDIHFAGLLPSGAFNLVY